MHVFLGANFLIYHINPFLLPSESNNNYFNAIVSHKNIMFLILLQ